MVRTVQIGIVASLLTGLLALASVGDARKSVTATAGFVTLTGSMSTARAAHTATLLPNGKVLIAGGMERNHVFFASAELYDPATGKFTPTGSMTTKRVGHRAVLLRNGKVLIIGGSNHEDGALASAELYDPATGTFTLTGSMKEKGGGFAILLTGGKVLITDGTSTELYDPATGSFTSTGNIKTQQPSTATLLTLLKNGKVLFTGSVTYPSEAPLARAELYDPARGTFSATHNMSLSRFKLQDAAVLLPNGKVLIAGGGQSAEVYDPGTSTFSVASGSLDAAWFFATATLLQSGKVLIVGGYRRGVVSTAGAWIYQS